MYNLLDTIKECVLVNTRGSEQMETIKRGRPKVSEGRKQDVDRMAVVTISAPRWFATELDRIVSDTGKMKSEFVRQILTEALQIQRPHF